MSYLKNTFDRQSESHPFDLGVIPTDGRERGWLSRSSSEYAHAWGDPNVSVKPKALRPGQPRSIGCV
jgi:hypothetical protein